MQIGTSKYSVGTANWKTRTPLIVKFFCDFLLFGSIVISSVWSDVDWALKVSIVIKLLSNFISEHMPKQVQEEIKELPVDTTQK
jgi:hypothetical protein